MTTDAGARPLVTLEVYSGRPNPSWPLEGEAMTAVTAGVREHAAGAGASVSPPPPALGYRGFRIEHLGSGAPESVFVGRGHVTLVRDRQAEHRRDSGGLERVLLADAASRGFGELLRAAGAPAAETR